MYLSHGLRIVTRRGISATFEVQRMNRGRWADATWSVQLKGALQAMLVTTVWQLPGGPERGTLDDVDRVIERVRREACLVVKHADEMVAEVEATTTPMPNIDFDF